jgi:tRNA(His) 5'-end guanylyltransferase
MYKNLAQSETFDPRAELKKNKQMIEEYLRRRAKMAWVNTYHMLDFIVCMCQGCENQSRSAATAKSQLIRS